MDTTVKEIADWARGEMDSLSAGKIYESDSAMYGAIAEQADLSRQTVRQFRLGLQPNLGADNLDKLCSAIRGIRTRLRAA